MIIKTKNKKTIVAQVIQAALLTTSLGMSSQALAENINETAESTERIEITGSRIARIGDVAPTPVLVVDAQAILDSGAINISDVLRELPSLLVSTVSQSSSGGSTGQASLNLRSMGEKRTLILVDGKRHVSGTPGNSSVDVNTIPVSFIERVEVITGGASAGLRRRCGNGCGEFYFKT